MAELRVSELSGGFVLYFEMPESRINAYALASTLVNLADAAKAAGRTLDSGIELEIVVEAISSGSFKARVTAIARENGLFLARNVIAPVVLSVLASYLYEHTLAKHEPIQVIVNTDEVLITQGDQTVIVPRGVHDAARQVAEDPAFMRSMDRMVSSVILDQRVTGFGLVPTIDSPPPAVLIRREAMEIRDTPPEQDEKTRVIEEDCDLYIVKAIMERSPRKWEFKWRGIAISAPIKDPNFYDDFARHDFTIAPGDEFQVKLAIHQRKDDISGVFTNTSYEVLNVYRHVSRPKPRNVTLQ
jgi:hypothetical protein